MSELAICHSRGASWRIAVLSAGRGSNLQALLDTLSGRRAASRRVGIALVVSHRAGVRALARARRAGVEAVALEPRAFTSTRAYGAALRRLLRERGIHIIAMSGWLLKLPPAIVREFHGRILNIHPSLLPLFGGKGMYGLRVHRAVLRSGMRVSGCTVHLVGEGYDAGPILLQRAVPVKAGDTPGRLAARILREEHRAFPEAVRMLLERCQRLKTRSVPPRPCDNVHRRALRNVGTRALERERRNDARTEAGLSWGGLSSHHAWQQSGDGVPVAGGVP